MRNVGVAVLGVLAGLVAGYLVFDELLTHLVASDESGVQPPWTFVVGLGPFVLAITGAVVAVAIHQRARSKRGGS